MQPSNTKHRNASPDARAADDAGGGILMTKDFRAARATAGTHGTTHHRTRLARRLGNRPDPALRPSTPVGRLTYTDASRRRVKLPCGRAVIRLARQYTPHDERAPNSRPGHNPDGDTANHAELVAIHAAIADAREVDQPPQSSRRGGHRPDHQRSAPTGETHLPPPQSCFNAFTTFWKESRQATRPIERIEGGRPPTSETAGLTWAPNGQPLRLPTTSQLPKGCTRRETIPRGRTA
jgi:hypothetical protein